MQPQLTRSNTQRMIAGVCGGLGEYFSIDPIIARLIFVLVTLTSGVGIPVYILLWILMPRKNVSVTYYNVHDTHASHAGQQIGDDAARVDLNVMVSPQPQQVQYQRVAEEQTQHRQGAGAATGGHGGHGGQASPQTPLYYDPQTGQPVYPGVPSTGETIKLDFGNPNPPAPHVAPSQQYHSDPTGAEQRKKRNWRKLSYILIGMGGLIFLNQFVSLSLILPSLMIIAGVLLLRRS
jgi:phage shock protein C